MKMLHVRPYARNRPMRLGTLAVAFASGCAGPAGGDAAEDGSASSTASSTTGASAGATTGADAGDSAGSEDSDSDSGADGESGESSGGPVACGVPAGSPPPVDVDGDLMVPIDVVATRASIVFDVGAQAATVTAELQFRLGEAGGMPIFDLRQTITGVEFDGAQLDPLDVDFFVPADKNAQRMRALRVPLEPCTEHTLQISYNLAIPQPACEQFPLYDGDEVVWLDASNDLVPGCYAEAWLPSNLAHDEFEGEVDLHVQGTTTPHLVVTNGTVADVAENHWVLDFPAHFTSMSLLVAVLPAAAVEVSSVPVQLPDGHSITVEVYRSRDYNEGTADIQALTAESLRRTNLELGEYTHGDRYVMFANEFEQDMEYDGATSTSIEAIEHEVFHSWVGRGMRPLTTRDSWFDEAWTTFYTDDGFQETLLTVLDDPVTLAPNDPWLRATDDEAYDTGSEVWATLADEFGLAVLRGYLRDFYVQHAGEFVTTEQLEEFLFCASGDNLVRVLFYRFVYGNEGSPADPEPGACG